MSNNETKEVTVQSNVVGYVPTTNTTVQFLQKQCNESLFRLLGDVKLVEKFVTAMILCFARNPKLAECTKESLRNTFLACAEFKLFPSNITGQCYVIPYQNGKTGETEAQFMIGYQGMITLGGRIGLDIDAQVVYEKDEFACTLGTSPKIEHKANVFGDRGNPVGVYATATDKHGKVKVFPMSMEDVYKHREKSMSWKGDEKKRKYSPWNPENDPQLTMPKKTAIRQLFKFIPKDDPTINKVMELDAQTEFGEVKEVEMIEENKPLTKEQLDSLFTELRVLLSKEELDGILSSLDFPRMPKESDVVILRQAVNDYLARKSAEQEEPKPAVKYATKKQISTLIERGNAAGLNTTGWLKSEMTESEYTDLLSTVIEAENEKKE